MTDYISNKMASSLKITKTTNEDAILKAKENGDDTAILSTFLPPSMTGGSVRFSCALKELCKLGDYKKTVPGKYSLALR